MDAITRETLVAEATRRLLKTTGETPSQITERVTDNISGGWYGLAECSDSAVTALLVSELGDAHLYANGRARATDALEALTKEPTELSIGHFAGCFEGAPIVFDAVQPDPNRAWYKHCYGIRGFAWAEHGSFERIYYFSPDYVDGNLRDHLESTIVSLWAVIRSEMEAAIAAPNIYGEAWQDFARTRPIPPPQDTPR